MATITVRISDEVRDALQTKAESEHQTLSDFVRARLEDSVFEFRTPEVKDGAYEIKSMSPMERHMLSLLHRILGRVLPEDANDTDGDLKYQLERAKVLERGFTREYWVEFAGLSLELTPQKCEFVMDVLDMFRIAQYSIRHLREDGIEIDEKLEYALAFHGFDHNDALEHQMSEYVRFLVKDGKWEEQKDFVLGHDRGNSHSRQVDVYSRMLSRYREVKQLRGRSTDRTSYLLTKEQLEQIAAAHVHPSNR